MNDNQDTVVVFTARSPERIVREGGSQAWKLNPARAKLCTWLVCTQNRHNPDYEFSDATEPHRSAFLIAKVSGVAPPNDAGSEPDRWLITISEYARINVPDVWDHGRNPVRYATLDELGITLDGLEFKPLRLTSRAESREEMQEASSSAPRSMTIEEAKKGLAQTFGVKPEAVEITIRG